MPRKNVAYAWADFSTGGGGGKRKSNNIFFKTFNKKGGYGKTKKSDSSHTTLLHDLLNNMLDGIYGKKSMRVAPKV